ncbi:MAG: cytochrome c3 family protein [Gemmatimonadaceae bacterium]|nr:cytochrome c3 family protein [Gemmatimonadaceae bacterium]
MTPRRWPALLITAAIAAVAAVFPANAARRDASAFPHARHAKLFPTCAGCHAGIETGDAAREFPAAASCASCHDGTIRRRVEYSAPVRRGAGFLTFSHPAHAARTADATCTSCHSAQGAQWMDVAAAAPERCASCHAHAAVPHLDDANKCTTCHRPLAAATALTESRVAALPKPPSHERAGFVSTHGATANASTATCATCHARESCLRCHVDGTLPAIQTLAADARVRHLVAGKAPVYPVPATHSSADFTLAHGAAARAPAATCSTCHARASCETCHTGDGAAGVIRAMPVPGKAAAPGVLLKRAPPPATQGVAVAATAKPWTPQPHQADTVRTVRVHPPGFGTAHGPTAASGALGCEGCHARSFCSTCHAGERSGGRFHPADFVSTHAPKAYGRDTDCSACHNPQAFCRSCHLQAGLAMQRSTQRSATFHNAQPLWLMQHGRAARQDLPSCTTCHQQTYCMQCHSQLGARINPHGPGFDASSMASRNSRICLACHFTSPRGPQ